MAQKKKSRKSSPTRNGANSLRQVREILFAQDRAETKDRTERIEKRLDQQVRVLKSEAKKRADDVKNMVKGRLDDLAELIEEERQARRKEATAMSKRITQISNSLDKKLAELKTRINKAKTQSTEQLRAECDELRAEVDEELATIQGSLTNRKELGKLLGDLAKRVGGTK